MTGGTCKFLRSGLRAVVAFAAIGLAPMIAVAETRVALVIGNAAYRTLPRLDKPGNDAIDITAALRALGFKVHFGVNLDLAGMKGLIDEFTADSVAADVTLTYYSGHGFQIGGVNVLAPVDFSGPQSVGTGTIAVQDLLARLDIGAAGRGAKPGAIHLIFLDACRNNPLKGKPGVEEVGLRDGLAPVPKRPNFVFSYATMPDAYSFEGEGGRNSFYARAFLAHLNSPGQTLSRFMLNVRNDVFRQTGGAQAPVEENALLREFTFATGPEELTSPETQLWQFASATNDPTIIRAYLDRYPAGTHMPEARAHLADSLAGKLATRDLIQDEEERLWTLASRLRDRNLVRAYLEKFPDGLHAGDARMLESVLDDSSERQPDAVCARLATHDRDGTESVRGVSWERLRDQAPAAIAACQGAVKLWPQNPVYKSLLARALSAGGRQAEAMPLFEEAARAGNVRAMVSVGLALRQGTLVPKDEEAAIVWFEKAAETGFEDGVINLTNILLEDPRRRDRTRAISLLEKAADRGSAKATFNLAVLANADKRFSDAATLFEQAGDLGYAEGYTIAAAFFDSRKMGRMRDPDRAAKLILKAAAADGSFVLKFVPKSYSGETVSALSRRLATMGRLELAKAGDTELRGALKSWSLYGSLNQAEQR